MVVVQASKLSLPNPSSLLCSPHITSLLFEPTSLSLALTHSDSTLSLYPSLSLSSSSDLSPPQTLITPPCSSSTFLLLQNPKSPNSNSTVLFIVSGPHKGGAQILLRFYVLRKKQFLRAQVVCTQKDLNFDQKLGVLVDSGHGVSIRLSGSVNFFSMYSVSGSKITVFAVRDVGDDDDGVGVKLMRCAVIDCCRIVWSISISFGFLILGEDGGVRVLNLRQLVKGKVRKSKNLNTKLGLSNGDSGSSEAGNCNGYFCRKNAGNYVSGISF